MSRRLDGSPERALLWHLRLQCEPRCRPNRLDLLTTNQTTTAHRAATTVSFEDRMKRGDTQSGSLDSDHAHGPDILKGDIIVGTIAGEEARQAAEQEHALSIREAVRLYPAAIGWSMFFSLGIIMTGNAIWLSRAA